MVYFEGPSEFKTRKSLMLRDSKNPSIIRATMYYGDKMFELNQNRFSIYYNCRKKDILQISHTMKYLEDDTTRVYGYWDDTVPLDTFRVLEGNTYIHTISSFQIDEDSEKAKFVIEFTNEAIDRLRREY